MNEDLVIGAISGYDVETLQCWLNSLDHCGFIGRKVVLVCNGSREVLQELQHRKYEAVTYAVDSQGNAYHPERSFKDEDVSAERFGLIWHYLTFISDVNRYRYVIAADTRDVIFQNNPTKWLETNLGSMQLNVSSEAVSYLNEPWNNESLLKNFGPAIHQNLLHRSVWNAGFIAGLAPVFRDLCLNVHLICRGATLPYGDQAALNIVLSLEPFRRLTRFSKSEDGWACHAGTLFDPSMRNKLNEPIPLFDGQHVYTQSGKQYCVVHQYDRVSAWCDGLKHRFAVGPSEATSIAIPRPRRTT